MTWVFTVSRVGVALRAVADDQQVAMAMGIDLPRYFALTWAAVGVIAEELQNLRADAMSTESYFIAETMGRSAGWLAYGVAMLTAGLKPGERRALSTVIRRVVWRSETAAR